MNNEFSVTARVRISRDEGEGNHSFSQGGAELLRRIDEYHSINKAAKSMKMAFSNAWTSLRSLEEHFGIPLTCRSVPEGTSLSAAGRTLLEYHDRAQEAAQAAAEKVISEMEL